MAHAGLALSLLLLYGLYRILHSFLRPLLWALLCSIPLRLIQNLVVDFWSPPLSFGLASAAVALPYTALRHSAATFSDLKHLLLRRRTHAIKIDFPCLIRWLASFALFLFTSERLGAAATSALFLPVFFLPRPMATAFLLILAFIIAGPMATALLIPAYILLASFNYSLDVHRGAMGLGEMRGRRRR